jgi:hypothetical protein
LVLARDSGFTGWQDLWKEMGQRLGRDLEWAAADVRRFIHHNGLEPLRQAANDESLPSVQGSPS